MGKSRAQPQQNSKTIPSSAILVPAPVAVAAESVGWSLDYSRCIAKKPPLGLLSAFVDLWRQPTDLIRHFAESWGPLDLQDDEIKQRRREVYARFGRPHLHAGAVRFNAEISGPRIVAEEPLTAWRFLSRRANAVLQLAIDLREGHLGREEDWKLLSTDDSQERPDFFGFTDWPRREPVLDKHGGLSGWGSRIGIASARDLLGREVNEWIRRFPFTLTLESKPHGTWTFRVEYFEQCLLSAISYQLALMTANSDLFRCSGCGEPYLRSADRRPKVGQANYCPRCSRGTYSIALRVADQKRNERRRAAVRMHADGKSPNEIATALGMKRAKAVQTIEGWLKKGTDNV